MSWTQLLKMNDKQLKLHSKFLSLVLRHRPEKIGLTLNEQGWVEVDALLSALKLHRHALSHDQLITVVERNDKQRFSFDETGQRIRANQGHSVEVQLEYESVKPPDLLYHGTPKQFVESIQQQGLKKQQRHAVHLHTSIQISLAVGKRRGVPVLLTIDSARMSKDGYQFYVTPNGVWLTDQVPASYISGLAMVDFA